MTIVIITTVAYNDRIVLIKNFYFKQAQFIEHTVWSVGVDPMKTLLIASSIAEFMPLMVFKGGTFGCPMMMVLPASCVQCKYVYYPLTFGRAVPDRSSKL